MKTLNLVFVTSHLDYCNCLLFGIPKYQTDRLQKVVNHISSNLSHLHREEYLQPHSISGHHLRSCDQGLFKIPKINSKTFGDCTFAHSGPLLWNKLLLEIQNSLSEAIFNSKLKTQLFKLAYNNCSNILNSFNILMFLIVFTFYHLIVSLFL